MHRDIAQAVQYVNYEENNAMNLTQVGQLMFVLGIFKYLYNEDFEKQQSKRYSIDQPLNNIQIKIEERKLREEEYLIQVWLKVNPLNHETVQSDIVLEFIKLIFDPYCSSSIYVNGAQNQEIAVEEYV